MDLLDKLKYYQDKSQPEIKKKIAPNLEKLAEHLNANILIENSLPLIKREVSYATDQIFPNQISDHLIKFDEIKIPLLSKGQFIESIKPESLLFFDLETTGLAGGAGTYPFSLGFGFFEHGYFKVLQYFLPEYDRDVFAYIDLKHIVTQRSILVSFNGKSYDYPLLRSRFILNRFEDIFEKFQHLDLLHLSRRVWKNSLENCSLQNIEKEIFKFSRVGDIEGYLIPNAYFNYLQSGEFEEIKSIIFHNEQDIVSLARLIFHLNQLENNIKLDIVTPEEYYALTYNALRNNSLTSAKKYLKILEDKNISVPDDILREYSLLLKGKTKWTEAVEIWENFIQRGQHVLFALEELAKYYEHKIKDYKKAAEYTNRALEYINVLSELDYNSYMQIKKDEFSHRANRISLKLASKR